MSHKAAGVAPPRRKRGVPYQAGRGFETEEQRKARRKLEDEAWAAMCGPVTVRYKEGYGPDADQDR